MVSENWPHKLVMVVAGFGDSLLQILTQSYVIVEYAVLQVQAQLQSYNDNNIITLYYRSKKEYNVTGTTVILLFCC